MKKILHQIIALGPKLESVLNNLISENIKTFNKSDFFRGTITTYEPLSVNEEGNSEHKLPINETKTNTTTVPAQIDFLKKHIADAINNVCTKEATNCKTLVDLNIGGQVFKVTSPELLALDKKIKSLRQLILTIPTVDPSKEWSKANDPNYRLETEPTKQYTTANVRVVKVLPSGTDKHPPYVDINNETIKIGYKYTKYISGELTSQEKADVLTNVDTMEKNIAEALQLANSIETEDRSYGNNIVNFVFDPIKV